MSRTEVGQLLVMWDGDARSLVRLHGVWQHEYMTAAVERRFVARRHVDYGRVRSAICPA